MDSPLSPPRLRSTLPAVDILGFFGAVDQALRLHLQTEKWPQGTQPTLVHDFPRQRLSQPDDPFDVITFHVGASVPAPTSNDGARTPLGPVIRDRVVSTKLYGYEDATLGWKELTNVVFTVWSRSNSRADHMVAWFHDFLMKYAYGYQFFRARGVDRFQFVKRSEDRVDQIEQQEIYQRFLEYQVRLEYVGRLQEKIMQSIEMNVAIERDTVTMVRPPQS